MLYILLHMTLDDELLRRSCLVMHNWKRCAVVHRRFKTSRAAIDRLIPGSRNTWFS